MTKILTNIYGEHRFLELASIDLSMRSDTARNWLRNHSPVPDGVIVELHAIAHRRMLSAQAAMAEINDILIEREITL